MHEMPKSANINVSVKEQDTIDADTRSNLVGARPLPRDERFVPNRGLTGRRSLECQSACDRGTLNSRECLPTRKKTGRIRDDSQLCIPSLSLDSLMVGTVR